MTALTRARIAELVALEAKATPAMLHALGGYLTVRDPEHTRVTTSIFHIDELGHPGGSRPYQAVPFARSEDAALHAALRNAAPQLLAAAQFVAELAERRCRCDEIATCDFGDRCDACRARALVTPDAPR